MPTISKKYKGIIYALISSGTFGLIPLFVIPLMLQSHMGETSILFYRYLFSSIAIGILCLLQKKKLRISIHTGFRILILSLFYTVTALVFIHSYKLIPSGTATTIHFLYPILVAFFMIAFYKEKISTNLLITAVISILGVALLSQTEQGFINTKGLLLAFLSANLYAIYIVGLGQKGLSETDGSVITFYIMAFGTLFFGAICHFTTGIYGIPDTSAWINILLFALIPTMISNITLVLAVKNAGATTASILGSAEPVTAVLIGVLIFSEQFTIYSFFGLLLIIFAVSYVILSSSRKKQSSLSTRKNKG